MKNVMRIIMVVITGNCMIALPPSAEPPGGVAHPIARPVVKIARTRPAARIRPAVGSPAWYARRMIYHARGQFGQS